MPTEKMPQFAESPYAIPTVNSLRMHIAHRTNVDLEITNFSHNILGDNAHLFHTTRHNI